MVFMAGVEEGIFPSQMAMDEGDRLDEERRLCYVGMTRAMKQLYITYAESRRIYGRENFARPSRFIKEIPSEYVQEIRLKAQVTAPTNRFSNRINSAISDSRNRPVRAVAGHESGFSIGQRVMHFKFGEGKVIDLEGNGEQAVIEVNFDDVGRKRLKIAFARLEKV